MGVEVPEEYGGAGQSFMILMLAVEELARVDPAVSALMDIHNTLVVSFMMKVASEEQKKKYLPILSQEKVLFF